MKIAVQIFSVRDKAEKDFAGTVRELKKMGYEGAELAGLYGHSFAEVKNIFDAEGLEIISAHVTPNDIFSPDLLEGYRSLGLRYLAVQGFGLSSEREAMKNCTYTLAQLGKICKEAGIQLLYHNHRYEFDKAGEERLIDIMYRDVPGELLKSEFDVAWISVCGIDPVSYLRGYNGRCPLVHFKDYSGKFGEDDFSLKSVGSGVIPLKELLDTCSQIGTEWVIVEQDSPTAGISSLKCAEMSIEALKKTAL